MFEQVTIIFNDIPAFLDICTKCDGMKIVTMLNTMFGIFDNLSDRNDVYKVETVKDSFVGVSGAPEKVSALNARKNDAIILSSNEILQLYIQAICIVMLNVNILTNSTCKCLIAEQKSC